MAKRLTTEQKQKLVDDVIVIIKEDVISGDIQALDELLKSIHFKKLQMYLKISN